MTENLAEGPIGESWSYPASFPPPAKFSDCPKGAFSSGGSACGVLPTSRNSAGKRPLRTLLDAQYCSPDVSRRVQPQWLLFLLMLRWSDRVEVSIREVRCCFFCMAMTRAFFQLMSWIWWLFCWLWLGSTRSMLVSGLGERKKLLPRSSGGQASSDIWPRSKLSGPSIPVEVK